MTRGPHQDFLKLDRMFMRLFKLFLFMTACFIAMTGLWAVERFA